MQGRAPPSSARRRAGSPSGVGAGSRPLLRRAGGLLGLLGTLASLGALLGGLAALGTAAARAEDPPAGGARLVFDREEHVWERAAQEESLQATFTYRNAGEEQVRGISAIGDCGCYGVTLSKRDLLPGEEGTLEVSFRTMRFSGRVSKRVRVKDPGRPGKDVLLRLTVDVVAGVVLDPGRVWFGDVEVGTAPSKTLVAKWHAEAGRPFQVTAVEVPGQDFEITTSPWQEPPWRGTAITLAFKEPPPLGMCSATAIVRTDHPDFPRITLPLSANVTGKVWVQARTIYMGWVPLGQAKRTVLVVRALRPEIELGTPKATVRGDRVRARFEEDERHAGWWRLVVEIPADAEPGRIEAVVEVHTQVPGEELTEIPVRGEVLRLGD